MIRFVLLFLFLPTLLFSQTVIYRSVHREAVPAAIATGAGNNLTISGTTATFASALPDSVGVGCAIQYDDDNDGDIDVNDSICFIHGRTSSTVFTVANAAGGTPTATAAPTQNWGGFHPYASTTPLQNWEDRSENTAIDADLIDFDTGTTRNISSGSSNEQWHIALYRRGQTGAVAVAGWTTGVSNDGRYIRFFTPHNANEVGVSQRNVTGVYSTTQYHDVGVNAAAIALDITSAAQVKIEYLQIRATGTSAQQGIRFASAIANSFYTVTGCLIQGFGSGSSSNAILMSATGNPTTYYISNNICYDFVISAGIIHLNSANGTAYVHNNTCVDGVVGLQQVSGTFISRNNLCHSNSTADFSGTFSTSEYNASSDATASGTGSRTNQTFTFVDEASNNFLLSPNDLGARNYGKSLLDDANLTVPLDAIGVTRPQGPNFDIGASEVAGTFSTIKRKYIQ